MTNDNHIMIREITTLLPSMPFPALEFVYTFLLRYAG